MIRNKRVPDGEEDYVDKIIKIFSNLLEKYSTTPDQNIHYQ